jgi:hypothetical protein
VFPAGQQLQAAGGAGGAGGGVLIDQPRPTAASGRPAKDRSRDATRRLEAAGGVGPSTLSFRFQPSVKPAALGWAAAWSSWALLQAAAQVDRQVQRFFVGVAEHVAPVVRLEGGSVPLDADLAPLNDVGHHHRLDVGAVVDRRKRLVTHAMLHDDTLSGSKTTAWEGPEGA